MEGAAVKIYAVGAERKIEGFLKERGLELP